MNSRTNNHDFNESERFLKALGGANQKFTFQTYDDRKLNEDGTPHEKDKQLSRILHGAFQQHKTALQKLNNAGAAVTVSVNETDGKGRRSENITRIRALTLDLDGASPDPIFALETQKPHISIETSPGKYRFIWLVHDCSLDEYPAIQWALAKQYKGDLGVTGAQQCVRIPGFYHKKLEPFLVRLVDGAIRGTEAYPTEWVVKGLELQVATGESRGGTQSRPTTPGPALNPGEKIPLHGRHEALKTAMGRLRNAGLSGEALETAGWEWYQQNCDPPHGSEERREVSEMRQWFDSKDAASHPRPERRISAAQESQQNENAEDACKTIADAIEEVKTDDATTVYVTNAILDAVILLERSDHRTDATKNLVAQFKNVLRGAKKIQEFKKALKDRKAEVQPSGGGFTQKISDLLTNIPEGCENHEIPEYYNIANGLEMQLVKSVDGGLDCRGFCSQPVVVSGLTEDIETGQQSVTVSFLGPRGWKNRSIPREKALDSRGVQELAGVGALFGSDNSKLIAKYLLAYCATNEGRLRSDRSVSHTGWIKTPEGYSFVLPHGSVGAARDIKLACVDSGGGEHVQGFRCEGTKEAWLGAAEKAFRHKIPATVLYASATASMLPIYGANNFCVALAGVTGSGKTKVVRFAASAFGNPNENESGGIVHGFNTTRTGLERLLGQQADLAAFLDDLQSGNTKLINSLVYTIRNGTGKVRGNIGGMQRTLRWNTVAILSGEASARDYCPDGGSAGGILSLTGAPFGEVSQERREEIAEIDSVISTNYGHFAEDFISYVARNQDKWETWKTLFRAEANQYSADGVGLGRVADMIGAIITTAHIIHDAGILPWEFVNPFEGELLERIHGDTRQVDIGRRSLQELWAWTISNRRRFLERGVSEPANGWVGRWENKDNWVCIDFVKAQLASVLTELGYPIEPCLESWHHHGYLSHDPGRRTKKVRFDPGEPPVNLIRIRRSALESVNEYPQDGEELTTRESTVIEFQSRLSAIPDGRGAECMPF